MNDTPSRESQSQNYKDRNMCDKLVSDSPASQFIWQQEQEPALRKKKKKENAATWIGKTIITIFCKRHFQFFVYHYNWPATKQFLSVPVGFIFHPITW